MGSGPVGGPGVVAIDGTTSFRVPRKKTRVAIRPQDAELRPAQSQIIQKNG